MKNETREARSRKIYWHLRGGQSKKRRVKLMNKRIESKRARGNLCRRFCRHISLHILIATHNVLSISWHDALQWGRCVCKQERWWMKISSSRRWKRHKERKKSFRIKGWRVILICIPCLYISFLDKNNKKELIRIFQI